MPKSEKSNEMTVAEAPGTLEVSGSLASQLADLQTTGFENVKTEDLGLTILNILQDNSPQVKKSDEKYIKGAEAGQFHNSLTNAVYERLVVVPVGFQKVYIEWIPRTSGGGFVGRTNAGDPIISKAQKVGGKFVLPNGHELQETAEHVVMVFPDEGQPFVALLPLKATQLRHTRRWLTEMQSRTMIIDGKPARAPMFLQKYRLETGPERNDKGSWYGLTKIDFMGFVDEETFQMTKAAAEAYSSIAGQAAAVYEQSAPQESSDEAINVDAVAASME